jgi:hypothetical protein
MPETEVVQPWVRDMLIGHSAVLSKIILFVTNALWWINERRLRVKLSLWLINHYAMKTYRGMGISQQVFVTSAPDAPGTHCIAAWQGATTGVGAFVTVFTTARHWFLSWARRIQSTCSHPTSLRSILILSSHLRLGLLSSLFHTGFLKKVL